MSKQTAPYGTWTSPVTADAIVSGSISIADIVVDPVTSIVYHLERRPSEKGRVVLVNTKTNKDVVGPDWNVRTAVQEYGGAAAIVRDGTVYFSSFPEGRVYKVVEGHEPEAVTPENKAYRYADFAVYPKNPSLLVAILEDHTVDTPSTVVTKLCVIDVHKKSVYDLAAGADFYASPSFTPDGTCIAWQQWFHPDMPWEGAEIHVGDVTLKDGETLILNNSIHVTGKKRDVSTGYPSWVSNHTLIFTSDESGYQNPWKYTISGGKREAIFSKPITEDFAAPAWTLGFSPYAKLDNDGNSLLFTATKDGRNVLYLVDVKEKSQPLEIECPYVELPSIRQSGTNEVLFIGIKADEPSSIVQCTLNPSLSPIKPTFETLKDTRSAVSATANLSPNLISFPKPMSLKIPPNDEPLHVVYYPPHNPQYAGSSIDGEKPPCVVNIHGGPTGLTGQGLTWSKQYYTTRGWAWLDVNYGGSSGYGRKYTGRLIGKWGIVDVEDSIHSVRALSSPAYNLIDPSRAVIRGGSAGGYTVLAALSIASDLKVFAAGTSSYGISDLTKLAEDTHKFESRYLEKLVGGTPEDIPEVYKERSPVSHADNIVSPLLILQGDLDMVVPKAQAEIIVKSIKDRGGYVDYKLYEGEGHGWRQEANIKDALDREIKFYEAVLNLKK